MHQLGNRSLNNLQYITITRHRAQGCEATEYLTIQPLI